MKKLLLLVLVTFVSIFFVGCGSSGSSSTLEDTLLSAVKDKSVDLGFDISLSNSFAASLRGEQATPFDLTSATVTVYKFENSARVSGVYYTFNASDITTSGAGIKATLPLNADTETLKELLLSENYEIEVIVGGNPILKSLFTITTQQKIDAIGGGEIACNVNPDSTAKAMLFEKLKAEDPTASFSDFISSYDENLVASLTAQIGTLLLQGQNIYDGSNFASSITTELEQAAAAYGLIEEQQGQQGTTGGYIISGTISGGKLTGTGNTIAYMLCAVNATTNQVISTEGYLTPLWPTSSSYTLNVATGTYKIKVYNYGEHANPQATPVYESNNVTVPHNGAGYLLNITLP